MQRVTTTLGYLFKGKLLGILEDCFTRLSLIPYHWGVQLAFQTNFTLNRSLGSDRLNSLVESSFFYQPDLFDLSKTNVKDDGEYCVNDDCLKFLMGKWTKHLLNFLLVEISQTI